MVANTAPIFTDIPNIAFVNGLTAANTAKDGTGTVETIFTAGADGAFVQKLKIRPRGTNVASVLRVFLNNGGSNATATNNALYEEISLPATTNTETASIIGFDLPLNIALPAGWTIFVTIGTTVVGGHVVTAVGGDY